MAKECAAYARSWSVQSVKRNEAREGVQQRPVGARGGHEEHSSCIDIQEIGEIGELLALADDRLSTKTAGQCGDSSRRLRNGMVDMEHMELYSHDGSMLEQDERANEAVKDDAEFFPTGSSIAQPPTGRLNHKNRGASTNTRTKEILGMRGKIGREEMQSLLDVLQEIGDLTCDPDNKPQRHRAHWGHEGYLADIPEESKAIRRRQALRTRTNALL